MFTSSFFRPLPLERRRAFLFPPGRFLLTLRFHAPGHAGQQPCSSWRFASLDRSRLVSAIEQS
jgi:hypothetical protein